MEKVYDYDALFYDRRFMNCGQRHAIVFLAELGVPVNFLFCSAWMSSDLVFDQMIVAKRPKFAFDCDFYAPQDLTSIGVTMHEISVEAYGEIAQDVQNGINRQGFVLLSGDVFYFPHCPEFRNAHAPHIVVLRGRASNGDWTIIDDNATSVLCEYQYPVEMVENFFNNNTDRKLRHFEVDLISDFVDLRERSLRRLSELLANRQDSYRFYDEVKLILDYPFDSLPIKFKALHDAFCLLSGSRNCFAQYLQEVDAPVALVESMREFSEKAMALKSMMVKAQITDKINHEKLVSMCADLKAREQANYRDLITFIQSVGSVEMAEMG